jgi:ABC-type methionine transport system permease subunit
MKRSNIFGALVQIIPCAVLLVEKSHKTKAALQASLLGISISALKSLGFVILF